MTVSRLPDEFLARKSTSVALHGTHRLANMPFTQIFSEAELADLPYARRARCRSPHGLLRRLNDLSCTGCHQGRTVAGFHFLGVDRAETDAVNAIAVGASPHFLLDQPRRLAYVAALATGMRRRPPVRCRFAPIVTTAVLDPIADSAIRHSRPGCAVPDFAANW